MRSSRIPQPPWWLRVIIVGVLGVAVGVMHSLVAGADDGHAAPGGGTDTTGVLATGVMATGEMATGAGHHRPASHDRAPAVAGAATASAEPHASDGGDCVLGHQCVFVRADDAPIPPIVLVFFVWGFAALPLLVGITPAVLGRLGRPPPWTQPTHLTLSVIRC